MKLPILYCLSWPSRLETPWRRLDLTEVGQLTFRAPDTNKYPCMELAYAAGRAGGTMPAVLNAANEEAVAQFLEERIHFLDIPEVIEAACERHKPDLMNHPQLEDVLSVDRWAREAVREQVSNATPCRSPPWRHEHHIRSATICCCAQLPAKPNVAIQKQG